MINDEILNELYFCKALGYRFVERGAERGAGAPSLASLNAQISRCNLCPLAKSRKNAVRGEFLGANPAPNPKVLIVSRGAPSKNAGWLNETLKILANIGVNANEIYLTHLIKCDSNLNYKNGANGGNLAFCAAQCKGHLLAEIALLSPRVALALGAEVFEALCGDANCSFASLRGGVFRGQNALVAPTYDPALIASNPSLAAQFAQDVAKLKGYL